MKHYHTDFSSAGYVFQIGLSYALQQAVCIYADIMLAYVLASTLKAEIFVFKHRDQRNFFNLKS